MRLHQKLIGFVLGCAIVVAVAGFAMSPSTLPSDQNAKDYFLARRAQFTALAASLAKQPKTSYLSADGKVREAKLLKSLGGQFLLQSDGAVTIYVWGQGCTICHDSYEGYFYLKPNGTTSKWTSVVRSLTSGLPKDGHGDIEDGFYILPLVDGWYIFREENG